MFRRVTSHLLIICLLNACIVNNQGLRTSRDSKSSSVKDDTDSKSPSGNNTGGQNLLPDSGGGIEGTVLDSFENGRAELQHFVDPFDGTFRQKVTIPKNFSGYLYLSGLNVTSLVDKLVSVKFKFGRELEEIVVPATIGRAPGLTPQTDIEVLIMDMRDRPFENIRLLYDLYDYNDYRDLDDDSSTFGQEVDEPTDDPRDPGLYCRGLLIEHDPTFSATSTNTSCDESGERCLYAYAKIADSGLYKLSDPDVSTSERVAIVPSEPQIDLTGLGYVNDSSENHLKKCLPDSFNRGEILDSVGGSGDGLSGTSISYGDMIQIDGEDYEFRGPFRTISLEQWEIGTIADHSGSAIFQDLPVDVTSSDFESYPSGLFLNYHNSSLGDHDPERGYGSFLFPRAAKREIALDIEYFGSTDPFGTEPGSTDSKNETLMRELDELVSSGDSEWMWGCNHRVSNYDQYSNEGVGSCNVTATIELITEEEGQEVSLTEVPSIDVKLQLIRPSALNYQGKEVLYTSMKTCSNNNACGSSECCFNNRCWDNTLVSQCIDDSEVVGNLPIGKECQSDFQCSSLCCRAGGGSSGVGVCSVHVKNSEDEVLCNKEQNEQCVAKEWCRKYNLVDCYIVKTGTSPTGVTECALRCYNVQEHGKCLDGSCQPPDEKEMPTGFDPENPDCSSAILPPTNLPIVPVPSDPDGDQEDAGGAGDGNP